MEQYFEIFITDLEGKQNVIRFLQEQFLDTTIYSLKFQIEQKTQVVIRKQSLSFGGRKLDFKRDDKIMTFEDYGIMNGANIIMDQRLMGGKFGAFNFTKIHKKVNFKEETLVTSTIEWRFVEPGLCLIGVCVEKGCEAYNDLVVVNKGFNKEKSGEFVLNVEVHRLNCPICKEKISTKKLQGIGIDQCKAKVETRRTVKEKELINTYEIESKEFMWAYSLNDKGKIKYDYIVITVKPLDSK